MESLVIRCVRVDNNKNKDDVITISPTDKGNYSIKTFYGEINKSYTQTISYLNVFGYVHSLVTLLIHDDKPFEFIQFDIPNTPSVLFNIKSLDCYNMYNAINTLLHVTLNSWNLRADQTCY